MESEEARTGFPCSLLSEGYPSGALDSAQCFDSDLWHIHGIWGMAALRLRNATLGKQNNNDNNYKDLIVPE